MATSLRERLLEAARNNRIEELRPYLSGDRLQNSDVTLEDILAAAARSNQTETVRECLEHGAKITQEVELAAFEGGYLEVYKALVPAGLDVNRSFGHAGRPLAQPIIENDYQWAEYLLEKGANPNLDVLHSSDTALATAAKYDADKELALLLVKYGADPLEKGELRKAAEAGNFPITKLLLEKGADVNDTYAPGKPDGTALHVAAQKGHTDVVGLLLEHKVDTHIKDANGKTALERARAAGKDEIVTMLERT